MIKTFGGEYLPGEQRSVHQKDLQLLRLDAFCYFRHNVPFPAESSGDMEGEQMLRLSELKVGGLNLEGLKVLESGSLFKLYGIIRGCSCGEVQVELCCLSHKARCLSHFAMF